MCLFVFKGNDTFTKEKVYVINEHVRLYTYVYMIKCLRVNHFVRCLSFDQTSLTYKSLVCFRIEVLKVKSAPGVAKLVGVVACLTGAATLAFYKGPHLELLSHYNLLGYHKNQQHLGHVASRSWIKGCFLMLLSSTFWGVWLVLQVNLNFLPSYSIFFFS